ncbi:MAG: hypothetical protein HY328_14885 [Chloroflexi bacterium]|nr:hypothetical protein [Chloroflexota bacterium]
MIWIGGIALLWFPGILLHRLLRLPSHPDWLVRAALQMGLGLALWPLLLLWSTQIGWRWSPPVAQFFASATVLLGIGSLLYAPDGWGRRGAQFKRQRFWLAIFACIAALTVTTRLLHIRDLALPAWVDSVHHVAIVRLLLAQGSLPISFAPFIPDGVFNYHWGFHALAVWLAWLLSVTDAFDLADLVLQLGQLLNALTVLMFYAAGRVLFASRRAGLLTAAIVGLVSWFPAYYLSWGRYTHLAGVLLMSPALLMLWQLRVRRQPGLFLAVVLLLAGLGMMHVRVAFLAALLVGLLAISLLAQGRWPVVLWWLVAAVGALLLTLPWWLWLWQSTWAREMVALNVDAGAVWSSYNLPNWGLVWAPRNPLLMALGTLGVSALAGWPEATLLVRVAGGGWLLLLLGLGIWAWRRPLLRQPTRRVWLGWLVLLLWVATTIFVTQSNRLGFPFVRFIHVNAGIITLFAPLGLAVGGLLAWVLGLLTPARWARPVIGVTALSISLWGASGMTTVVNPSTILATPADRAALLWVRDNTPANARFVVNTWEWINGVYAGSDGGYWIPVLTDRASLLPPSLYASSLPPATVQAMNALFRQLASAPNLDDPALRARLAAEGVTHLYLGAQGGALRAEQIDGKSYAALIYRRDGVSIYRLGLGR